jgi:hypothetical protein
MDLIIVRKNIIVFFVTLLLGLKLYAQQDCVKIKLSVSSKGGNIKDGILVNINLLSNCSRQLKIHKEDFFLIDENDAGPFDGYFEVKADNIGDTDSSLQGTTDCDPSVPGKASPFRNLLKGQSINYKFDLGCYYHFVKGHIYHIRFRYKLSKLNPSLKDIWSSWLIVKK